MKDIGWVMLGSGLGGIARFWLSNLVGRRIGETFPWGTMAVNVSGSLAIGIAAASALSSGGAFADPAVWRLAVVGFLGSYTTVSSFSLQTLALARDGDWRRAFANIALSLVLCLAATALGLVAGSRLTDAG